MNYIGSEFFDETCSQLLDREGGIFDFRVDDDGVAVPFQLGLPDLLEKWMIKQLIHGHPVVGVENEGFLEQINGLHIHFGEHLLE